MAKVLDNNSVKVLGIGASANKTKARFTFSYTDGGVSKRGREFVTLTIGDTKEQATTKAIAAANAILA